MLFSTVPWIRAFPPPPAPPEGGGMAGLRCVCEKTCVLYETAQLQLGSGHAGVLETKWRSSVLFWWTFLWKWFAADCIPIVGAAKSLVPKDKRFNHTKVWCTFIFIYLQATGDCEQRIYILYVGRQITPLYRPIFLFPKMMAFCPFNWICFLFFSWTAHCISYF